MTPPALSWPPRARCRLMQHMPVCGLMAAQQAGPRLAARRAPDRSTSFERPARPRPARRPPQAGLGTDHTHAPACVLPLPAAVFLPVEPLSRDEDRSCPNSLRCRAAGGHRHHFYHRGRHWESPGKAAAPSAAAALPTTSPPCRLREHVVPPAGTTCTHLPPAVPPPSLLCRPCARTTTWRSSGGQATRHAPAPFGPALATPLTLLGACSPAARCPDRPLPSLPFPPALPTCRPLSPRCLL